MYAILTPAGAMLPRAPTQRAQSVLSQIAHGSIVLARSVFGRERGGLIVPAGVITSQTWGAEAARAPQAVRAAQYKQPNRVR